MRFKKLLYSASKIALKSDVKDDSLHIKTNKKNLNSNFNVRLPALYSDDMYESKLLLKTLKIMLGIFI